MLLLSSSNSSIKKSHRKENVSRHHPVENLNDKAQYDAQVSIYGHLFRTMKIDEF